MHPYGFETCGETKSLGFLTGRVTVAGVRGLSKAGDERVEGNVGRIGCVGLIRGVGRVGGFGVDGGCG